MDRTKYLNMARECAMIRERGLFGTPVKVHDRLRVVYRGIEYCPQSYELGFEQDGTTRHTAVLHDLEANAVVYAPLADVKEKVE